MQHRPIHRNPLVQLVLLTGFVAAVVLLVGSLFFRQQDDPARPTASPTAQPVPTIESYPAVRETLDRPILQKLEEAVRLYASYPSSTGKNALLDQLKPLVSDEALDAIEQQWTGPDIVTVVTTVTEVRIEPDALPGSTSERMTIRAMATQDVRYSNTEPAVYESFITVVLEKQDGEWVIVHLSEAGA